MHEMALCQGVVDLIDEEAARQNFGRVKAVVLEIGVLGHVEPEAMLFCFDAVSRGTRVEGARLVIERVPGAGWCLDCGKTVPLTERFGACPDCGRHRVQMTAGDELKLRELEVE
ncbi:hydrogenase maturation nickel metallochaperone HypA [Prosthecomicrobium hirschii]|jgi:hydrogenase nickel incorporation protein HypA/HybF|uniref:hydrogenase maturation nickel metallochaperone HypA n=1 Tax=Prosthecodimorpha hirschii TaxID=665126 RepID=UPI00112C21D4|nr:hydrogenase maturation nickel metallochaperone HypA [Prosthecomicrobium hirschii]MCW1841948.1 hydrogenase maturation nickel metallochaperone HypA [Prosthecomicrobium hirschii]TPQ52964.1 hydrogenase maturation nickel metallochaperone HypA [Prosthecomicrobium hirschii]